MIANNSYRLNYEMNLWEMHEFCAQDLIDRWNDIYRYASTEETKEDIFFLADCMDVLNEKVLMLSEEERMNVLEKARKDVGKLSIGDDVFRLAG